MYLFSSIEEAIKDIQKGKMVIVIDDEDRENEGDFVMAAQKATADSINFMAKFGRGLICTPLSKNRANELGLNMMVESNQSNHQTAFTVSVDSSKCSTGISTYDRYLTIKDLCDEDTKADDLLKPGHIFPLVSKAGGVLTRAGHTEAAVDLSRLAGFKEVGVICEIMNDDGTMARVPDLFKIAQEFDLKIITIKDLVEYRKKKESFYHLATSTNLPTKYGDFQLLVFENMHQKDDHHMAIVKGHVLNKENVLVRLHSECLTGDTFGSLRCDCGEQLEKSFQEIEKNGEGVILYLKQEGRGIGLVNKIKAYALQEKGHDTVSANHQLGFSSDLRDYSVAAQILRSLEVKSVKIMTNNPHKIEELEKFGVKIAQRLPLEIEANNINLPYLTSKRDHMGHMILRNLQ